MEPLKPGQAPPWVVAHRGASHNRPENTAPAFEQALAEGCDGFELDLQLSRDAVPVVYHDRTLSKIGAGSRAVADLSWQELQSLDAGAWFDARYRGTRLLRLEDVLEQYAGRTRLFLEIKAREDGERLEMLASTSARLAVEAAGTGGIYLLCFEMQALQAAAAAAPELPRVLNMRGPAPGSVGLPEGWEQLAALSIDVRRISMDFVDAAHRRGKPVLSFTCNDEARAAAARECGADLIFTDRPAWLRRFLEGQGGR